MVRRLAAFIDRLVLGQVSDSNQSSITDRVVVHMALCGNLSLRRVLELTESPDIGRIRDSYILMRSVVETLTNAAYVSSSGEDIAHKAIRHVESRYVLERKVEFGSSSDFRVVLQNVGDTEASNYSELADEFFSKRGSIKNWTDLSLPERIKVIASFHPKAAFLLSAAYTSIYSDASEVLHGSLFGCVRLISGWSPGVERGHVLLKQAAQVRSVANMAVGGFVGAVGSEEEAKTSSEWFKLGLGASTGSIKPEDTEKIDRVHAAQTNMQSRIQRLFEPDAEHFVLAHNIDFDAQRADLILDSSTTEEQLSNVLEQLRRGGIDSLRLRIGFDGKPMTFSRRA